jgi:hypothetical protein
MFTSTELVEAGPWGVRVEDSGAKELFAELAEEEEKHRELLEHVSVAKVFQEKLDPIPGP